MPQLINRTKNQIVTDQLMIAESLFSRMKGLLGRKSLEPHEMLWINPCNSIHTFFMSFSIDCVFLNKEMKVCAIKHDVSPWRIILPIFAARSVIELPGGQAKALDFTLGDQLYVGY